MPELHKSGFLGLTFIIFTINSTRMDTYDNMSENCNYADLDDGQKRKLFDRVNIFRGLRFTENKGIERSFNDLYTWNEGYLPDFARPHDNTVQTSAYSFSKMSHELKKLSVNQGSASLNSQFASAESEFRYEKNRSETESHVNEYLLEKFTVRKANFDVDFDKAVVSEKFVDAVAQALDKRLAKEEKAYNLVKLLNEWGYYVPKTFTLGGCLYSEEVTRIDDYSVSESEKESFSASFKSSFESIGGGGAFGGTWEKDESSATSEKYKNLTIKQIGGVEGMQNDYQKWITSLFDAKNWDMAECEELYPSVLLLRNASSNNEDIFLRCLQALNCISTLPQLWKMQPFVDLVRYNSIIQTILNPF